MKRLSWFLAFLPPLAVQSSLRGSVIPKSAAAITRQDTPTNCPDDCSQLHGKRTACHDCPRCQWFQRTNECQDFQFQQTDPAQDTAHFCGCPSCTQSVWDLDANGFSCGFRIRYYTTIHGGNYTMQEACSRVATRYDACTSCMPGMCDREESVPFQKHHADNKLPDAQVQGVARSRY